MDGGLHDWPGGITSLCRLIDRYGEAIEYDLLMAGRSLDQLGYTLSWRDLWVLFLRWQKTAGTATGEAVHGHMIPTYLDDLTAGLFDLQSASVWQRGGKRGAPKPKPVKRPWLKPKARVLGSAPIPISQFHDWWDAKVKEKRRGRRR